MKKTLLFCLFCGMMQNLGAQTQTLNNILSATVRGTGAIIKDNTVTGYYSFAELDKKNSKSTNYQLSIYDQNLAPLSSKKFASQGELVALEASFNGDLLMIKYYDAKTSKFSLKTYDQNAEQVNSKSIDAKKVMSSTGGNNADETESHSITPIEGAGFIHMVNKIKGAMMGRTYVEVTFIPNKSEDLGWKWETPAKSEVHEAGTYLGHNNNVLLCLVTRKAKLMSSDLEDFIVGIDMATGRKIFDKSLEDKKYAVSLSNGLSMDDGNFQLFGFYYEKDAKTMSASSLGLFSFVMDTTGTVLTRTYKSWQDEVSKFLKVNEHGKIKDVGHLYFHKFIRTADNKIFAISEQFKNNVGGSVARSVLSAALGGSAVVSTYNIEDIYLFEFDEKFNLKGVSIYDKSKSSYTLQGAVVGSSRIVGVMLKYLGQFDYTFTQQSKDKSKFSIGYVDYDKTKGQKGWYFGSINYSDGKLTTDKVKFDTKSTWQHVYQGKPGYVMISEYFKKEKKMEFRMEKVNF
jgi:hypothetical protein